MITTIEHFDKKLEHIEILFNIQWWWWRINEVLERYKKGEE